MDAVTRLASDFDPSARSAIEQAIGKVLRDDQQIVIVVKEPSSPARPELPDWCNVFGGLSDDEVAELEQLILAPVTIRETEEIE